MRSRPQIQNIVPHNPFFFFGVVMALKINLYAKIQYKTNIIVVDIMVEERRTLLYCGDKRKSFIFSPK